MPFRFQRVRANGEVNERDSSVISPRKQYKLFPFGQLPYRALPYPFRPLYDKKMNEDFGNIFCSPFPRISYKEWLTQVHLMTHNSSTADRNELFRQDNSTFNFIATIVIIFLVIANVYYAYRIKICQRKLHIPLK